MWYIGKTNINKTINILIINWFMVTNRIKRNKGKDKSKQMNTLNFKFCLVLFLVTLCSFKVLLLLALRSGITTVGNGDMSVIWKANSPTYYNISSSHVKMWWYTPEMCNVIMQWYSILGGVWEENKGGRKCNLVKK